MDVGSPIAPDEALRLFEAAWNEQNESACRELLRRCCAENAELAYPDGATRGPDETAASLSQFREAFPDARIAFGPIDAHHGFARVRWRTDLGDGIDAIDGDDFVRFGTDGRITVLITFDGRSPDP